MKKLLFAMLAAAACSGCVSRVADLTLCSTKNVDLKIPHPVDTKRRVTGETRTHIVILIPFGQESIKEAIQPPLPIWFLQETPRRRLFCFEDVYLKATIPQNALLA